MRPSRVAPFIALAVAVVMAGLFVVLLGRTRRTNETAETHLMGQPAPEARGELADGSPFDLSPAQGQLGRAQLLRLDLRAVRGGAPRAGRVRRASRRS